MDKTRWRRCTFVLPRNVHRDLCYLSETTGKTQSALVRDMLGDIIPTLATIVREVSTTGDLQAFQHHMDALVDRATLQYKAMQEVIGGKDH